MRLSRSNNFNEIYNTYYRKSFMYVKSYVHDDMTAEDIVSESLIKLWERLKESPIDSIDPFLFTILKNRTLDHLKHQSIKRGVQETIKSTLTRELEIRTTSLENSLPDQIFTNEIQEIINRTLQSLPDKTKEIFLMSRFENISHKEIAEKYNISAKGVDYHIAISVSELRQALKDYLPIIGFLPFLHL